MRLHNHLRINLPFYLLILFCLPTLAFSKTLPAQHQDQQPGIESVMKPLPISDDPDYKGSGKLLNKVAIITGGDSGIGKAAAIAFAKEGADIAIVYLNEHQDAKVTKNIIEKKYGRKALLLPGDLGNEAFCQKVIAATIQKFGKINILVNNAGEHQIQDGIEKISAQQLTRTFQTNIFSMFYLTKAALPYLHAGDTIINTASVVAFKGNKNIIDYAATKGAVVAFTRSLASSLVKKNIRVNAVAPGPIWTPLIPSAYPANMVETFGEDTPMGRPGQPAEVAPSFVFLASKDSSYMTGQILHPNGGIEVGG